VIGNGPLAEFPSAVQALKAVMDMQGASMSATSLSICGAIAASKSQTEATGTLASRREFGNAEICALASGAALGGGSLADRQETNGEPGDCREGEYARRDAPWAQQQKRRHRITSRPSSFVVTGARQDSDSRLPAG
jgi:hypothetical protein